MSHVRRFVRRWLTLFRSGRAERDLARELDAHLQLIEDDLVSKGMTRPDARRAARRAFHGVEQTKELQRDARSFRWLAGWPMDLKLGARMLVKTPGLTVTAVTALAVAIGAGAAYLEFTRDLINPRLPLADGDRIVGMQVWNVERRAAGRRVLQDFAVWREHATTLDNVGAEHPLDRHLITDDGRVEPARGVAISASAFRLDPTPPLLGRTLVDEDESPGAPPVVVIGYDLWHTRFDGDPHVLGRTVRLGSAAHTIVGIMPEGFTFPINQNLWAPLKAQAAGVERGQGPPIWMFGRLKEEASLAAAQAELQGMLSDPSGALRADVRPYLESLLFDDRSSLEAMILYTANLIFLVLLAICCANVATLVFARTVMREGEITLRTALGASRGRISAQLFAEALVLSSLAAIAGLAVASLCARWATGMWTDMTGQPRPFWWNDRLSPETLLYAAALSVFAALLVGVIPALKATGARLQNRLRDGTDSGASMRLGGLWTGVIVTQAAFTVVFLGIVASLGWTIVREQQTIETTLPLDRFLTARLDGREATVETLQALAEHLRSQPGVADASYTTALPVTGFEQFFIEFPSTSSGLGPSTGSGLGPSTSSGQGPSTEVSLQREAEARMVTDVLWSEGARVGPDYFETVGIPLVAGRRFTTSEILGGHPVAIVDEAFVRLILGGRNPLGLMVRQPAPQAGQAPGPWHEIVGVVEEVVVRERKTPEDAMIYRPAGTADRIQLLVRTHGPAAPMARPLQAAALTVNPDLRLADVMTLDEAATEAAMPLRIFLRAFAVIAAIGLLLSTAGIYALVSFTLARRTREIGIRVALGAAPRRIITGVFRGAFTQIGAGVLLGALPTVVIMADGLEDSGRMGLARGAAATLALCAFILLVALVSCAAPLRRALRIEPTQALRVDG